MTQYMARLPPEPLGQIRKSQICTVPAPTPLPGLSAFHLQNAAGRYNGAVPGDIDPIHAVCVRPGGCAWVVSCEFKGAGTKTYRAMFLPPYVLTLPGDHTSSQGTRHDEGVPKRRPHPGALRARGGPEQGRARF